MSHGEICPKCKRYKDAVDPKWKCQCGSKLTPQQLAEIRERLNAVIDLIGPDLQDPFSDTEALLDHATEMEGEKAELVKSLRPYLQHGECRTKIVKHVIGRGMTAAYPDECTCGLDELLSQQESDNG